MSLRDLIKKSILPLAAAAFLLWIGKGLYMEASGVNIFALWLLLGIPFGIPYLFVVIPTHWDLSGTLGLVTFCIIIGGLFGGIIAAFLVIRALALLVWFPIAKLIS